MSDIDIVIIGAGVKVTPNPEITNFPTDYEICFDENIPISGVTTTGVESSVEWTSDGDGTFDNTSSLNPSYFPSSTDIANGSSYIFPRRCCTDSK